MRPRRPKPSSLRTRSSKNHGARKRVSYVEPASDPGDDDSQVEFAPDFTQRPRRGRSSPLQTISTRPTSSKKRKAGGASHVGYPKLHRWGVEGKGRKADIKASVGKEAFDIIFTGKAMPWQALPYHILEVIFQYAAYPLVADDSSPNPSMSWLVRLAPLCKGFAEPALSTLYHSPPLSPKARVRKLITQLEQQDDSSYINYRAKIKRIDLEAIRILGRISDGLDYVDLTRLLRLTPQLRGMDIHLLSDVPRWHNSLAHARIRTVSYPPGLEQAMADAKIRLQDWTWNSHLAGKDYKSPRLSLLHMTLPFQSLRHVSFINYGPRSIDGTTQRSDIFLGQALKVLPALRSLAFRRSSFLGHVLCSIIPIDLQTLEITDCPILSFEIEEFLVAKGRNLRRLVLDHNRRLNLSWLPVLASACPRLEVLKMDMIYHNHHATFSDSDPTYAYLISLNDKPSWPATLQRLELYYLRKWSADLAELFFSSLVDSASSLPDLRNLSIRASLDVSGWRDRIAFRDRWIRRLNQVFLRNSTPPNPNFKSLASFKAYKANAEGLQGGVKLRHIEIPVRMPVLSADKDAESDSDRALTHRRNSRQTRSVKDYNRSSSGGTGIQTRKRRRRRRRQTGSDGSSEEDSALEDDNIDLSTRTASEHDDDRLFHTQGMCNVVDVMIDNLRPTEEQLHESDFLDDEVSGDEDWNGDDDIPGDGGYAW
ncbi:MAG: hypothetical protein Q9217_006949 [Psora testacea]